MNMSYLCPKHRVIFKLHMHVVKTFESFVSYNGFVGEYPPHLLFFFFLCFFFSVLKNILSLLQCEKPLQMIQNVSELSE